MTLRRGRLDAWGAALAAIGLGSLVFGVIEGPARGWSSTLVVAAFVTAAAALLAFVALESRLRHPMLPLSIFRSRQFAGANAATLLIYAAVYGTLFLIPLQLQQVLGYSPLEAGIALLPITAVMLVLSPWAGRLSQRVGPRLPMTAGPLLAAVGLILLSLIQDGSGYVTAFLPAVTVFSLGLALTVSPLTAAVLAAAPGEHAGLASAINNTAARAAGVIAVAALPVAVGLTGAAYLEPTTFATGYRARHVARRRLVCGRRCGGLRDHGERLCLEEACGLQLPAGRAAACRRRHPTGVGGRAHLSRQGRRRRRRCVSQGTKTWSKGGVATPTAQAVGVRLAARSCSSAAMASSGRTRPTRPHVSSTMRHAPHGLTQAGGPAKSTSVRALDA